MRTEWGLVLVAVGLAIVVLGLLAMTGALGWFGRLPGDVRFEGEGGRVRVYVPLVSMLVVSLGLTVLVNLVRRLFG